MILFGIFEQHGLRETFYNMKWRTFLATITAIWSLVSMDAADKEVMI